MATAQEIFRAILKNRGITDVNDFAKPSYETLGDPFLLPDMDKAVKRIALARQKSEKLAVYGDYDVDGMTATTLLMDAFSGMGFDITSFIPDRFVDGYGMSERGIDKLAKAGVKLLITVDTGSLAHKHVLYAKQKHGIDVIVTDHHAIGLELPAAVAVINPKREDSSYPSKELAGVGVAFTLIRALQTTEFGLTAGQEKWLLDLVALGTVCDIVPLIGENRTLVYWGLQVMAQTKRPGLASLLQIGQPESGKITTQTLGYRIGPRLNAAGRLTHADISLRTLRAGDAVEAVSLARQLDVLNSKRRQEQQTITEQALAMTDSLTEGNIHIFVHPKWSHGIVGIVASKLVEELGKPVFVLQQLGDTAKGSGRSFGDFHLANAIAANKDLLISGGGHAYAAGITLKSDKVPVFEARVREYFSNLNLQQEREKIGSSADMEIDDFSGLNMELLELMQTLEPYGTGNDQPLFIVNNIKIQSWRPVGADGKHAKIVFSDDQNRQLDGIGFGLSKMMPAPSSIVSVTTRFEANEYQGRVAPQLSIQRILPSSSRK